MSVECIEEHLTRFQVYDKAVDIVSCWEAYLSYIYRSEFTDFYFDRFPSLEAGEKELTPDFTAFFSDEYGLIAEIKRTFPNGDTAIRSELEQIAEYDQELAIQTGDGDYVTPEKYDIMVLIEGSSAPQIGLRLQRIIDDGDEDFDAEPVLLRYQYNQDALRSRYEFQRVTQLQYEFKDDHLDIEETLYSTIGEGGDYETLPCYPQHFKSNKVQKPLCNDTPPGPYLATFLWHKIFPEYLTTEQYEKWQGSNGQSKLPITVSVPGVMEKVNEYMHDGRVRKSWIRKSLEFLEGAELAECEDDKEYEIGYMGLVKDLGSDVVQEEAGELAQTRELARTFIQRYCENTGNSEDPEVVEDSSDTGDNGASEQSGISDWM